MGTPQAKEGSQLLAPRAEEKQGKYSWNIIKSATILISELILGISMTILSAVLHDLSLKLDMSYTQLSIANSMASVGAIFGSVAGGFLTKRMSNYLDLILFIVHFMNIMALISIPFTANVVLQSLEWFMQGWAMAVGYVVNNMVAVRLWPDSVGTIVLLVSAANSIGHTAGCLLPIPFVSHESTKDSFSSLVYVPFIILALIFVANGINLLIQYAVGLRCHRCYNSDSCTDAKVGQSEPQRTSRLLWLVVPGMGIVYLFVRVSDMMPAYLAPSIGIESSLHLPASKGDLIILLYNIHRTISKLVTSFLLKRVSVMLCLPICLVMTSLLAVVLFLVGLNSVSCFFAIMIAMGLFTGPPGALLLVWVSNYVIVDDYALSVWLVADNFGILSSVLVGGIVFDYYGCLPSLFVNLINGIIASVTFFVLQCIIITKN
ncbi:hypothetical protein CAPTEDRAFT_214193 [Capitella teleta]|uniref:Major facilitator superfamily (MFS) profile domain-containing protein n=1 Tax=Capitella teleta TaxID=283909 RepID=R7TQ59_CAPTE|nr:hypothetical protein CAPTEDRAFT_214193 [Capitella teleta]|eukprot:ELT96033.1 hypothetical protein CAPTEDRAFT_214193 [Capitella teleta]